MKIEYSPIIYFLVFLTIVNGSNIFNKDHSTSYPTFDGTVSVSDGNTGKGTMDFTSAATVSVNTTGSGPQVPSTSTQPPSEALLFLTDEIIYQVVDDWSRGSNSRKSVEAKYGPIEKWDVSRVTNMFRLFYYHDFDGDISEWDVSQVTNMGGIFAGNSFDLQLCWDISKVTYTDYMFGGSDRCIKNLCCVNCDSDLLCDKKTKDKKSNRPSKAPSNSKFPSTSTQPPSEVLLFLTDETIYQVVDDWIGGSNSRKSIEAKYGPIEKWDVSRVTNMFELFYTYDFDGDISEWDVSQVTDMGYMFSSSSFNGDVSQWDVSQVTYMDGMFSSSSFNGDVSQWNVSQVTDMRDMFVDSSFDQQLCWDISKATYNVYMFGGSDGCIKYSCCVNCDNDLLCD